LHPPPLCMSAFAACASSSRQMSSKAASSLISEYRGMGPELGSAGGDRHSNRHQPQGAPRELATTCPACAEEQVDRCSCCLREKLSIVPRMKIAVVGKRLAAEHAELRGEAMPPDKLVAALADYARSSAVAAAVNQRFGFPLDGDNDGHRWRPDDATTRSGVHLWGHRPCALGASPGGGGGGDDVEGHRQGRRGVATVFACDRCDRHADRASDVGARLAAATAEAKQLQAKAAEAAAGKARMQEQLAAAAEAIVGLEAARLEAERRALEHAAMAAEDLMGQVRESINGLGVYKVYCSGLDRPRSSSFLLRNDV